MSSHRLRNSLRRVGLDRVDLALVLVFVCVLGPWVNEVTAQPSARYLLTAAIVEERTVVLDDYEEVLGVDRVEVDGHVYSDKAPLQPILGVPVLAAAQALGVPPAAEYRDAESVADWVDGNVGAWTQTFAFAVLPGAALLPLMRRHLRRFVDDRTAIVCSLAIGCSTMVVLFSTYLYAHVLSALFAFASWHVISSTRLRTGSRMLVGGALAALGFATEYPVLAVVAVLGLWVWSNHGFRRALVFGAPSVIAGGGVLAWNQLVYGTASTSYGQKDGTPTFIGIPKLYNTVEIFFGRKGFIFTPVVLLAIAGLAVAVWRRNRATFVPAGVLLVVYLLQASWPNPWGGETANPRYMLLALPFLAYPLAIARGWVSAVTFRTLTALGTISMGLGVVTLELVPDGAGLITTHLRYLSEGDINTTVFALAFGGVGWLVYALIAGGSIAHAVIAVRAKTASPAVLEPSLQAS